MTKLINNANDLQVTIHIFSEYKTANGTETWIRWSQNFALKNQFYEHWGSKTFIPCL